MNTRHIPTSVELPSSQQLLKSTCTAIVTAAVLLVTVVLPSEYAIDPTGIGRALGLTEMGEIKTQLAAEAEADLAATPAAPAATTAVAGLVGATSAQASAPSQPAPAQVADRNERMRSSWRTVLASACSPCARPNRKLVCALW